MRHDFLRTINSSRSPVQYDFPGLPTSAYSVRLPTQQLTWVFLNGFMFLAHKQDETLPGT